MVPGGMIHTHRFALVTVIWILAALGVQADVRDFTVSYTWSSSVNTSSYRAYVPLPVDAPVVRGVVMIYGGTGGDYRYYVDDPILQDAARSLGFALIGADVNGYGAIGSSNAQAATALNAILTAAATATARPELVNVPIISTGHSLGGFSSCRWASYAPQRTLAVIGQRGSESPYGSDLAASLKVPLMIIPGSKDGNTITNPGTMVSTYTQWRSASAANGHASWAVDWLMDHDSFGNQTWPMVWTYIAEAIACRYPAGVTPSTAAGNPVPLVDIPLENGWLAQRAYVSSSTGADRSTFGAIAPYNDYTGTKTDASWLPNETVARVYQALNSYDGVTTRTVIPKQCPLAIVGDAAPPAPAAAAVYGVTIDPQLAVWTVGSTITITVDPREFDDVRPIVQMDFYDGAVLLGTKTASDVDGKWRLPVTLATRGIHSVTVVATNSLGNKTSTFQTVVAASSRTTAAQYVSSFEGSEYVAGQTLTTGLREDSVAGKFWRIVIGGTGSTATATVGTSNPATGTKHLRIVDPSTVANFNISANLDLTTAVSSVVTKPFTVSFRGSTTGITTNFSGVNYSFGPDVSQGGFSSYNPATPLAVQAQWLNVNVDNTTFTPTGGTTTNRGLLITILTSRAGTTSISFRPRQADGRTLSTWADGGYFTVSATIDPYTFAYTSIVVNGVEQIGIARDSLNGNLIPATSFYIPANATPNSTFRFYSNSGNSGTADLDDLSVTPSLLPAAAPTSFTATAGSGSSVVLQWVDNSAAETGFQIERRALNGDYALLQTLASNTTTFTDTTALPGVLYEYRVRYRYATGDSAWATPATVTASGTPTGYQLWLQSNGLAMDGGGNGAPAVRTSVNGYSNLLKYALGLPASAASSADYLSQGLSEDSLTLTYTCPEPPPSGLVYTVETSNDLQSWSPANSATVSSTVNGSQRTTTMRDTETIGTQSKRFMRLRVTMP